MSTNAESNSTLSALSKVFCNITAGSHNESCDVVGSVLTVAADGTPVSIEITTAFGLTSVDAIEDDVVVAPYVELAVGVVCGVVSKTLLFEGPCYC